MIFLNLALKAQCVVVMVFILLPKDLVKFQVRAILSVVMKSMFPNHLSIFHQLEQYLLYHTWKDPCKIIYFVFSAFRSANTNFL